MRLACSAPGFTKISCRNLNQALIPVMVMTRNLFHTSAHAMTHMININRSTRTSEEENLHEGLNTWDSSPFVAKQSSCFLFQALKTSMTGITENPQTDVSHSWLPVQSLCSRASPAFDVTPTRKSEKDIHDTRIACIK